MTSAHLRWATVAATSILAGFVAAPPAAADSIRDRQWHLKALDVQAAHRITQGEGVTVAVIDSGVKADHPDLVGSVLPGIDYGGEETKGWKDHSGHGTAMAALIAGHGHDNGDGVLGIAPKAKILPVRDGRRKVGDPEIIAPALTEAVRRGAKVVSMSIGVANDAALERAVQEAIRADVVLVAAMGNRPKNFSVPFPARYPGVVAVGATGRDGKVARESVTGPEMVLSAPGVDIVSADGITQYQIGTGTSDSTAIVAGAAALIRARFPDLTATQVIHRLTATAKDEGPPGRDPQYGYGALDLVKALTADVNPTEAQPVGPAPATPTATGARPSPGAPTATASAEAVPAADLGSVRLSGVGWALVAFVIIAGLVGLAGGVVALIWFLRRRSGVPRAPSAFHPDPHGASGRQSPPPPARTP